MDSLIDGKDILSSFENSDGDKVSITESLVIYSTNKNNEENNVIYPIKRIDSYNILKNQEIHYFGYGVLGLILWFWLYGNETYCTFLFFGCESNFFQSITDGWWLLLGSAICFFLGFIKENKLTITSVSQEKIEIVIYEINEEKRAKEFINELNRVYSRHL